VRIGLVQVNMGLTWSAPAEGAGAAARSFGLLPYSVGLLAAYAREHARDQHEWLVPIHRRLPVAEAAEQLAGADLVGFSAYVWNVQVSLAIAERVKQTRPETIVVFGGPQVPDHPEAFLRAHPYVDVVCHGEGEATFTRILDAAPARHWAGVPGVSFLDGEQFVQRPRAPRIADLDTVPSPFLSGAFDDLIAAHPQEQWVAMWETNRGCPFSCSFCDWGSATASKVYRFGMPRLHAEIDWMAGHRVGFVFCCDANFGMLPRDLEIAQAVVASKERCGFPHSFSVQNTKNAVERGYRVQTLLNRSLNAYGATISLQSVNDQTLQAINRANISSDAFAELQHRFAAEGVYTYTDIIIGLPGETYDEFAHGVAQVVLGGQHNHIQFHNCSVLPNAEMGNPTYQRRYGMRTVAQVMRIAHASVTDTPEVEEYLDLVVETAAMPDGDWQRAKVFAWLTDLLYFDRLLQVPLLVLSARHGLSLRTLIEGLMAAEPAEHPLIAGIGARLRAQADQIAAGGEEYIPAPQWDNLRWPADQYVLIELVVDGTVDRFYDEAERRLIALLAERGVTGEELLVHDAVELSRALLKRPELSGEGRLVLAHNVWEHYQALMRGSPHELRMGLSRYLIDRGTPWPSLAAWCQHLAWCQNKDKRAYLYPVRAVQLPAQPVAVAA
jgi:radical SAM superfamily enzyme YgiQ (UPF0313 family)